MMESTKDPVEAELAKDVDLKDASSLSSGKKERVPRRILHFSDGTLEEYSTEEEEEEEEEKESEKGPETAIVDPKTLAWFPWMIWLSWTAGSSVLSVCDSVGERLAWWLGITSPKYYYEIQEAIRMKEEEEERKKQEDAEMAGWRNRGDGDSGQVEKEPPQPTAASSIKE